MKILKPQKISYNNNVFLSYPSGRISSDKRKRAFENMQKLNLYVLNKTFPKNFGHFAASDFERLKSVTSAFNKQTNSIFCIRGGYGATRYLHKIDYDIIKQNPKIFIGFSDITALQSAFFVKTGLVSFHGIVAASEFSDYTIKQLNDLIFNPVDNYVLPAKSFNILNKGNAKGRIVGGNLSLLISLIGTEYLYPFKNNIVFIEEVAEPPYKIDRMLNHLLMATDLKDAAAIVFGKFYKCEPEDFNMSDDESFEIKEIIKQNFSDLKIPVIFDVNFGHIKDALIFPIGLKAQISTSVKQIKLLEKAVI